MDLTPGQCQFPFVASLEAEHCAREALSEVMDLLAREGIATSCGRRTDYELERIMVLADELLASLLAP